MVRPRAGSVRSIRSTVPISNGPASGLGASANALPAKGRAAASASRSRRARRALAEAIGLLVRLPVVDHADHRMAGHLGADDIAAPEAPEDRHLVADHRL